MKMDVFNILFGPSHQMSERKARENSKNLPECKDCGKTGSNCTCKSWDYGQ